MRILILTLGSHGDVVPYVALGRGLQAAGHRVSLCTCEHFAAFVAGHGLDYRHMNNGFVDLVGSLEGRAAIEGMQDLFGTLRVVARLLPKIGPLQVETQQDAWQAARDAQPDLIIFHPKVAGAVDIADLLDVPAIMAPLFPQYVATAQFPSLGFPDWPLGDRYRRGTYRLVHALARRIGGGPIHRWRRNNLLPPAPPALDHFSDGRGRTIPTLHGFSPVLCPTPADWPDTAVVAGAWPLDEAADWRPPDDLAEFLAGGPPPVYIGFGSMAGRHPERRTRIVLDALQRAGCRGLLATGWGGIAAQQAPAGVHLIDQAPHGWLFPRVAAVVHHGGAGTTAAGLRAGRPTVICPFFGDQPFWGRQVYALGAGPAPISPKRLTAERLAEAIIAATRDPAIAASAAAVGERLRAERGIDWTVDWIERWVRQGAAATA